MRSQTGYKLRCFCQTHGLHRQGLHGHGGLLRLGYGYHLLLLPPAPQLKAAASEPKQGKDEPKARSPRSFFWGLPLALFEHQRWGNQTRP